MKPSFKDAYESARLPIKAATDQISAAVLGRRRFVLSASPGSGKTTLAPLLVRHLLDETGSSGRLLIAQPRRVAVRSAARYVASLIGETPGERVGWTMRGDRAISEHTRIEFTTTGTLLRRLIGDPDLEGIDALLIDEVHERHLDSDLALAFALDIADLRDDLLLGVMSATADTERFRELLGSSLAEEAVAIEAPGKPYPLDVVWTPPKGASLNERGASNALLTHLADTALEAFAKHGSTLVFAPSIRDVEEVAARVRTGGVPTFSLHSTVAESEQDAALLNAEPRVIVATDIAETSLTVPGVNCVVDSGLARTPRYDVARDTTRLVTIGASRSSAIQRAGRAHRTAPGTVYRCYSQTDYARMRTYAAAEIESADLTEAALLSYAWSAPGELRMLSEFPKPALERATRELERIGALAGAAISDAGRVLARVPVDPRAAHALLLASKWSKREEAVARVVAAMSSDTRVENADITRALSSAPSREVQRLSGLARRFAPSYPADEILETIDETDLPGVVLGLAFPGRIAKKRGSEERRVRFLSASGTGLYIDSSSPLASEEWISASSVLSTAGTTKVLLGAPLNPRWAHSIGGAMRSHETVTELSGGRLRSRTIQNLGAIQIGEVPAETPIDEARIVLASALKNQGLALFKLSKAAEEFVRKAQYVSLRDPSWPELSGEQLAAHVDELVGGSWPDLLAGASLQTIDLLTGLKTIVGWDKVAGLDSLIPDSIELPSGNRARITFDPERGPTVRVKLQETFGFKAVPEVLGEPLTFELLSPAGRPLAITSNLQTFFDETYPAVRAEMRGRYPKHPWPEDPWTATATNRTNARLRAES